MNQSKFLFDKSEGFISNLDLFFEELSLKEANVLTW